MSNKRGFTLIELLIVVAIIAILAAIAVPNFLEAQTRAKVSRAKTDMRSVSVAIESYSVDWNRAPLGQAELGQSSCCAGWLKVPTYTEELIRTAAMAKMTTPLAYMTTIPADPFAAQGNINYAAGTASTISKNFGYQSFARCFPTTHNNYEAFTRGYMWALRSIGPLRNNRGNLVGVLLGKSATGWNTGCTYDPTNGTMSIGWLIRTNKGELRQPPGN